LEQREKTKVKLSCSSSSPHHETRKMDIFGSRQSTIPTCKVDLFRNAMRAKPAASDPLRKVEPNGTLTASLTQTL